MEAGIWSEKTKKPNHDILERMVFWEKTIKGKNQKTRPCQPCSFRQHQLKLLSLMLSYIMLLSFRYSHAGNGRSQLSYFPANLLKYYHILHCSCLRMIKCLHLSCARGMPEEARLRMTSFPLPNSALDTTSPATREQVEENSQPMTDI